jgi:DMSO/TMAO reductase YedYZ heme-binding membrane subunit
MGDKKAKALRSGVRWFVELTAVIIVLTLWTTPSSLAFNLARAAGLLGYIGLFLAILSHEYMKDMRQLYGKPYLAIHHRLAQISLALTLLHPIMIAWLMSDVSSFVPRVDSFHVLLVNGGRVALYLFILATAAGFLRNRIKSFWKYLHWLNYVAFFLVFAHSWLLGTNVSAGALSVIWPVMALVVLIVFVRKHLLGQGKPAA